MRRACFAAISLVFVSCGGGADAPPPEDPESQTAVGTFTGTNGPASSSATRRNDRVIETTWEQIPAMVSKVIADDESGGVQAMWSLFDERRYARRFEEYRLQRVAAELSLAMVPGASSTSATETFQKLVEIEEQSLYADRQLLVQILELSGPDGRALLWEMAEPEELLLEPRGRMVDKMSNASIASSVDKAKPDEDLDSRRLRLSMRVFAQTLSLDLKANMAGAAASLKGLDPTDDTTPAGTAQALAGLDVALIEAQKLKFDKLREIASRLPDEGWFDLVERGTVQSFVGTLGGNAGVVQVAATSSSSPSTDAAGAAHGLGQGGQVSAEAAQGWSPGGQQPLAASGGPGGSPSGSQGGVQGGTQGGAWSGQGGNAPGGMGGPGTQWGSATSTGQPQQGGGYGAGGTQPQGNSGGGGPPGGYGGNPGGGTAQQPQGGWNPGAAPSGPR